MAPYADVAVIKYAARNIKRFVATYLCGNYFSYELHLQLEVSSGHKQQLLNIIPLFVTG